MPNRTPGPFVSAIPGLAGPVGATWCVSSARYGLVVRKSLPLSVDEFFLSPLSNHLCDNPPRTAAPLWRLTAYRGTAIVECRYSGAAVRGH